MAAQHGGGVAHRPAHLTVRRDRRAATPRCVARGARAAGLADPHAHRVLHAGIGGRVGGPADPQREPRRSRRRDRLPRRDPRGRSRLRRDDGLVVPVVHDAQALGFAALGDEINRLTAAAALGGLPPRRFAEPPSPSPTTAPKADGSRRRSCARRRSRSSGAARSVRSPWSTATRSSRRRHCRSRCRPITASSTVTTRPRSRTRSRRSCASRRQLLDRLTARVMPSTRRAPSRSRVAPPAGAEAQRAQQPASVVRNPNAVLHFGARPVRRQAEPRVHLDAGLGGFAVSRATSRTSTRARAARSQ